jgi:hypothetical protein
MGKQPATKFGQYDFRTSQLCRSSDRQQMQMSYQCQFQSAQMNNDDHTPSLWMAFRLYFQIDHSDTCCMTSFRLPGLRARHTCQQDKETFGVHPRNKTRVHNWNMHFVKIALIARYKCLEHKKCNRFYHPVRSAVRSPADMCLWGTFCRLPDRFVLVLAGKYHADKLCMLLYDRFSAWEECWSLGKFPWDMQCKIIGDLDPGIFLLCKQDKRCPKQYHRFS